MTGKQPSKRRLRREALGTKPRYTAEDEWARDMYLDVAEQFWADPSRDAVVAKARMDAWYNKAQKGPPPAPVLWVRRWWPTFGALSTAFVVSIVTIWIGLANGSNARWPPLLAGFGAGVFASAVVALVVLVAGAKQAEIREIESGIVRGRELKELVERIEGHFQELAEDLHARISEAEDHPDAGLSELAEDLRQRLDTIAEGIDSLQA